ncbi:hypothetical protein BAE29_15520 [Acidithiobacillus caldus]|uniref:Uncharacterized protein n=1 Tax=Acidithiobacillus caldus TaxID=33059 RepID=A0A1E7YN89_9PROT|nr:hypothetical protein BAE29_15520 [Acidithiobacillus caldus]OFC36306.1 hypothetical protein BAE27_06425 [Acidithiobacillus caldus]OFC39968.1 hypothetical protein BAE28_01770 [Acidithiobacillus caldus]
MHFYKARVAADYVTYALSNEHTNLRTQRAMLFKIAEIFRIQQSGKDHRTYLRIVLGHPRFWEGMHRGHLGG